MDNICNNPKPTYNDMALIPAQGRDPAAVNQDVADARAQEQARRAVPPAMGRDPQWVYECNTDCGCQSDGCPEG